jgi:hypothetical protein
MIFDLILAEIGQKLDFVAGSDGGLSKSIDLCLKISELCSNLGT